jgi:pyrroline-5-carboxylate reductase
MPQRGEGRVLSDECTLAFIGGGNMARALIGGLLARGWTAAQISVGEPDSNQRGEISRLFPGIEVTADNAAAASGRNTWVLAVKPQQLREVATALVANCRIAPSLVISVAAGIPAGAIRRWLGGGVPVVRSMPNRPALLGAGMTGLFAGADVGPAERERAERILQAVGATAWVRDEFQIDAVTAVSGSGPAYFFLLIELLESAGVAEGLDPSAARTLAIETAYGAALMARGMQDSPATLREQVTSKGGTTEAALSVLRGADLPGIISRAVHAARVRSAELAEQYGT